MTAFFVTALLGCATAAPPLPDNVRVVEPTNAPPEAAVFSGKWTGRWDIGQETMLVVEEIEYPQVTLIYAVGPHSRGSAGWARKKGTIVNGILTFPARDGAATVTFRAEADGTLSGKYETSSFVSKAQMVRAP